MKERKLYVLAILYIYIPMFLFIVGWTAWWIALPVLVITIVTLGKGMKQFEIGRAVIGKPVEILLIFVFFFLVCVFCGGGNLFSQDFDWEKHHAILNDLVCFDWPVVYQKDVLLTYYLGQYIVPAFVGKVFGKSLLVMNWMVPVWNAIGLTMAAYLLFRYLKADSVFKRMGILICMILFGGATNLGSMIYRNIGHQEVVLTAFKWLDMGRVNVHYASNFNGIRGAFQHIIVPWVSAGLFLNHTRKYKVYVLLALPLLFSSTFGFVWFCVLLLAMVIKEFIQAIDKKYFFRQLLAISNCGLLPLAVVILIYLAGNFMGDKPQQVGFVFDNLFQYPDFFIIFILVEFGIYMLILFPKKRKDFLFWMVLVELIIIPFFQLGLYNDLCSRGSVPARFLLMAWCLQYLYEKTDVKMAIGKVILLLFLGTASINSLRQAKEVLRWTLMTGIGSQENVCDHYGSFDGWAANPDIRTDEAYNYYTLDYADSLFYKIAKK